MPVRRRSTGSGHGGAWVISFADLMALLMAFFVMLLSFSEQDQDKLNIAAGSVQDAFGIQQIAKLSGVIERNGNPERSFLLNTSSDGMESSPGSATNDTTADDNQGQQAGSAESELANSQRAAAYASAAASLKTAWQDNPEITSAVDNIALEETDEGLNIVIADRDGHAMFPEGSKYPFEVTRKAIAAMAPALQKLSNQVRISGHTATGTNYDNPRYGPWELSFDRANITRQILEEFGLSSDRVESVIGRGDADPFFPNEPYLSVNQRVTITLVFEKPPVPVDLKP